MASKVSTQQRPQKDSADQAILISNLVKTFGHTRALDGVNLQVNAGEIHGFLGPNGSGKSTTIGILLGTLRADSGEATVLGMDPWRDPVELHRRIAHVPGDVELWPNLTGGETIDLLLRLRGGGNTQLRDELIERFDLDPRKKGRSYSKGNRQKVALIAALASDAELLLLDEPTSGLDPLMESVFREYVHRAKDEGRTVLLSSHILSEVEQLADRISIIRKGRVVETGSLANMRHLSRTHVMATTKRPVTGFESLAGVHDFSAVSDTSTANADSLGTTVRFHADPAHLPEIIQSLAQFEVESLTATPPTLEELLLSYYEDKQ